MSNRRILTIAAIALIAVVMVMSIATPAMADHDNGNGKSNDGDNRKNCEDEPSSENSWNCKAGEPRKRGQS